MTSTTSDPAAVATGHVTPVMAQYIEIKAANPDCLLFYRMGDFYELFFDDAVQASRALGIALTKRGQHLGQDIPMAGVPIGTADDYLAKLIRLGYRVAVCEQLEDPAEARKRGHKAVVKRDVVRLITPGTITEEKLLVPGEANYLLAVARTREGGSDAEPTLALAWIDISTGEFRVAETTRAAIAADIARIAPREVVIPDALGDDPDFRPIWRALAAAVVPIPRGAVDGALAERRLEEYFGVRALDGFGRFSRVELLAAATAVAYVDRTQIGKRPPLSPPVRERRDDRMEIDAAARANLELLRTLSGERAGSLLWAVDHTVTPGGGRELARRLSAPALDMGEIEARLDAVATLLEDGLLRADVRAALAAAPDMPRALARLAVGRGGPRDLAAIRDGLSRAAELGNRLSNLSDVARFATISRALAAPPAALSEALGVMLADELPLLPRDGGFVRAGFDADLDRERGLKDDARGTILGLQQTYVDETQIRTLRIKHNNVLGYFVEVGEAQAARLFEPPLNATFFHRQTLASQVRFTTAVLSELEARIAGAADRALALEQEIFARHAGDVLAAEPAIRICAEALAELDVHAGFAEIAAAGGWCRPRVDASRAFRVVGGRHPVVERALAAAGEGPFVANDVELGPPEGAEAGRILLLTGPNMAGKSTYLRQCALIAILAQTGAYVPATEAEIGMVDRLHSRVGAADDLARGRSTFMVEMVETAAILNQAGERSLVILDEIGRGTATFDGLSIAWATIEHLHDVNRCRALFATHFHELTALAAKLARVETVTMKVKEWQGDVVFLHEVGPGAADRSYGIQVAKLAGLPGRVVERARDVLARLEEGDRAPNITKLVDDLPLFASLPARAAPVQPAKDPSAPVVEALSSLDPDAMTPREALDAVYRLKRALDATRRT
jgi:DNA mismatch repair protein MutS